MRLISNTIIINSDWEYNNPALPCDRVILKGMPANTDNIWLNIGAGAAVNRVYPIAANETITIGVSNLADIHLAFPAAGDKIAAIYEKEIK